MSHRAASPRTVIGSIARLDMAAIAADERLRPRVEIDERIVGDYARALESSDGPPVVVFFDGSVCWLADGHHRHAAHVLVGRRLILCDVRSGTFRDAHLFSAGANASETRQRSGADTNRAIETLLFDAEWTTWSDERIAAHCGVTPAAVAAARLAFGSPEFSSAREIDEPARDRAAESTVSLARDAQVAAPSVSAERASAPPPSRTATSVPAKSRSWTNREPYFGPPYHCAIVDYAGVIGARPNNGWDVLTGLRRAFTKGVIDPSAHVYVFTGDAWAEVAESLRDLLEIQESPIVWTRTDSHSSDAADWLESRSTFILFGRIRGSTRKPRWPLTVVFGHPVTVVSALIDRSISGDERANDPTGNTIVNHVMYVRQTAGEDPSERHRRPRE